MAKRPDVQYIRYYVDGSAARKLEPVAPVNEAKTIRMPALRKQKRTLVFIDPVAVFGVVVAVCMLVMMLVGVVQLKAARQEVASMQLYVSQLNQQNNALSGEYANGYDLNDIEEKALALGMVPADQIQRTSIDISEPAESEAPVSLWEQVGTFLAGIFA